MNENLQPVADEHLEARITAYILGEASPFEAAEIESLIAKSPELKLFANRTRTLNDLLKEAETTSNSPDAEWKLSGKKRAALNPAIGPIHILTPLRENRIRRASFRAAFGIAAIFIVTLFTLRLVPSDYEAEAIIEIKPRQRNVDPLGGPISGSPTMTSAFFGTEFEKVKSRNTLKKVVDTLDLTTRWNTDKETAIKRLKENVETKNIRGTDLISIRVRDANEEDAKAITREITKSYRDYRNELEKRSAEEAVEELKKAVIAQEDKVEGRRQTLTSLSRSQNYISRRGAGALADAGRDASKKGSVEANIDTSDFSEAQYNFEADQKLLETMKLQLFNRELNQGMSSSIVDYDAKIVSKPWSLFKPDAATEDRIAANAKTTNRVQAPPTAAPEPKTQIDGGASSDELADVERKPKAPASAMAKVIAANTANPVAIPVPDVGVLTPSADFGDGADFGGGWGDGGDGFKKGKESDESLAKNGLPESAPTTAGNRSGDGTIASSKFDAIPNDPARADGRGERMRELEAPQDSPADPFMEVESLALTDGIEPTDGAEKPGTRALGLESQKKLAGNDEAPIVETRSMPDLAQREMIRRQAGEAERASIGTSAAFEFEDKSEAVAEKKLADDFISAGIAGDTLDANSPDESGRGRYAWRSGGEGKKAELQEADSPDMANLFSSDDSKERYSQARLGVDLDAITPGADEQAASGKQRFKMSLRAGTLLREEDKPIELADLFSGNGDKDSNGRAGTNSEYLFQGMDLSGLAGENTNSELDLFAENSDRSVFKYANDSNPLADEAFEGFMNYGAPISGKPKQVDVITKLVEIEQKNDKELGFDWMLSPFTGNPAVTTRSGSQANLDIIREFTYPSEFEPPTNDVIDRVPILGDIPLIGRLEGELTAAPSSEGVMPPMEEKPVDLADLSQEIPATQEPFSTFSLNVSDASFQVASSAVAKGERPDPESIKPEQFYNAVSYDDPSPSTGQPVAADIGQVVHPVIPGRNLVRMSVRTASTGRAATQPLVLTLLVDQSGSMARGDRRAAMDKALSQLATLMQPDDRITVIGFSRTANLLADSLPGDEAGKLPDIINQSSSEGGTNLEQAINLAESLALRHKADGAQNRIVLFTDGAANLGNADPERLAERVKTLRQQDLSFDIAGIGTDDINDRLLSELARHGNGRYYLVGENTGDSLAKQLAGAFRPAAENVKIQVKFNPLRVGNYKLIGFEKDRLKTEDFRNDSVDAAELAADESGTALYQIEPLADGSGEIGELFVRFRDTASGEMVERSWTIPYEAQAPAIDKAQPSMQLATLSLLAAQKLQTGPLADAINFRDLAPTIASVKQAYSRSPEAQQMVTLINALK